MAHEDSDRYADLFAIAERYRKQELYDKALSAYTECLEFYRQTQNRTGEATVLGALAALQDALGHGDEAVRLQLASIELADNHGTVAAAWALVQLGIFMLRRGQGDDAKVASAHFSQAEQTAKETGNLKLQSSAIHQQALLLMQQNNLPRAEPLLLESLRLSQLLDDKKGVAASYATLGRLAFARARLEATDGNSQSASVLLQTAVERLQEAYELFRLLQQPSGMAKVHYELAYICAFRREYQTALEHLQKARALVGRFYPAGLESIDNALEEIKAMGGQDAAASRNVGAIKLDTSQRLADYLYVLTHDPALWPRIRNGESISIDDIPVNDPLHGNLHAFREVTAFLNGKKSKAELSPDARWTAAGLGDILHLVLCEDGQPLLDPPPMPGPHQDLFTLLLAIAFEEQIDMTPAYVKDLEAAAERLLSFDV